jgi:hypothetical protein
MVPLEVVHGAPPGATNVPLILSTMRLILSVNFYFMVHTTLVWGSMKDIII